MVKSKFSTKLLAFDFFFQSLTRDTATEIAINVKALYNETESLLVGRVPLVRKRSDWSHKNDVGCVGFTLIREHRSSLLAPNLRAVLLPSFCL